MQRKYRLSIKQSAVGRREFPIVKDTTPNITNPRLYITSNHGNILNNPEKANKINDFMCFRSHGILSYINIIVDKFTVI